MTAPAPGNAVQTLGPADPNAPTAKNVYVIATVAGWLISAAAGIGILTSPQAASLTAVIPTASTFVISLITAVAAFRTRKQINNGTFDAAPPPPPPAPQVTAVEALQTIGQQVNDQIASSVSQVQNGIAAIQASAGAIGALGAQMVPGPLGDLLRSVSNEIRD